jgi:hypothetical protein
MADVFVLCGTIDRSDRGWIEPKSSECYLYWWVVRSDHASEPLMISPESEMDR